MRTDRSPGSVVAQRQRPLRARYREHPADALARKSARTSSARIAATDPLHGEVEVGTGHDRWFAFAVDSHVGGADDGPNPGDLLCAALAACHDASVRMIAERLGVDLVELGVETTGTVDVRGCLGLDERIPVGFGGINSRVRVVARQGTDPELVRRLVAAADHACVNLATLRGGVEVEITLAEE